MAKKYVNFGPKPWNNPGSQKINSCVNLREFIHNNENASTVILPDLPSQKTIPKVQKKKRYFQKRDMMVKERILNLAASVDHFDKDTIDPK